MFSVTAPGKDLYPFDPAQCMHGAGATYSGAIGCRVSGRKASLTENVQDPDLPRLLVFIGRNLTAKTGCTMRNLRHARRLWRNQECGESEP
jgi:hypothetical protein